MKVLERSLAQHPDDRVTFLALATFSCDAGDIGSALGFAEQLSRINPNDRDFAQLTDELRSRLKQWGSKSMAKIIGSFSAPGDMQIRQMRDCGLRGLLWEPPRPKT